MGYLRYCNLRLDPPVSGRIMISFHLMEGKVMAKRTLLIVLVVITVGAFLYWFNFNRPMVHEDAMQDGVGSHMGSGKAIAEVEVPNLSPVASLGERLFIDNCAACHNTNAVGWEGLGPPLVHKIYEPSHHGDEAFQLAVKNGVRAHHWTFGDMASIEGLKRTDVEYIVMYVRELQRANGIK